jgi:hypothetical protein
MITVIPRHFFGSQLSDSFPTLPEILVLERWSKENGRPTRGLGVRSGGVLGRPAEYSQVASPERIRRSSRLKDRFEAVP